MRLSRETLRLPVTTRPSVRPASAGLALLLMLAPLASASPPKDPIPGTQLPAAFDLLLELKVWTDRVGVNASCTSHGSDALITLCARIPYPPASHEIDLQDGRI